MMHEEKDEEILFSLKSTYISLNSQLQIDRKLYNMVLKMQGNDTFKFRVQLQELDVRERSQRTLPMSYLNSRYCKI